MPSRRWRSAFPPFPEAEMIPLRRLRSIVLSRHAAWASARVVLMATLALAAAPRAGAQWVNLGHSLSGGVAARSRRRC